MRAADLVNKARKIATQYRTLYVSGGWGQPATPANKTRAINQYQYNRNIANKIRAASSDTFFFDCVCLIKAILWGWDGVVGNPNGGAKYASGGVPDVGEGTMINMCREVSTDFRNIIEGEAVYMAGHIGIYIGDGLAVECTPAWNDCVQITAVANIGRKDGYHARTWTKHGKLPWVDYSDTSGTSRNPLDAYTDEQLAQMVISGHFGNGSARTAALGARYASVQKVVDAMLRACEQNTNAKTQIHVVAKGENLTIIAKRYNTSVDKIVADNKVANRNLIHVGQRLIING